MTHQTHAQPRRGLVCIATCFILVTIFLAAARLASLDLPVIRRRPSARVETEGPSPADAPMSYGQNARPGFSDISVHIASLPDRHVPSRSNPGRRLVIVGDVHGMRRSLEALLAELRFDTARGDHLVLAGDLIDKGPDSPGVVDLAMSLDASAVRGNHEDRVLLAHRSMKIAHVADEDVHGNPAAAADSTKPDSSSSPSSSNDNSNNEDNNDDLEPAIFPHGDSAERATARSLSRKQLDWLSSLPVILEAGTIESLGNLVVVHAGLVPGVPLPQQDPWAVMNMRGLIYPREELRRKEALGALEDAARRESHAPGDIAETMIEREHERRRKPDDRAVALPTDRHGPGSSSWTKAWNRYQRGLLPESRPRTTVVYGHDAKSGLSVGEFTFGLDSGCVGGGELTALVIEATADGGVRHEIKSVKCDAEAADNKTRKQENKKKNKKKKSTKEEGR